VLGGDRTGDPAGHPLVPARHLECWRKARDAIDRRIMDRGWSPTLKAFVHYEGGDVLDVGRSEWVSLKRHSGSSRAAIRTVIT
jgi:hypothetical protein